MDGNMIKYGPGSGLHYQGCATNDGELDTGVLEGVQRAMDAAKRACAASDEAYRLIITGVQMPNGEEGAVADVGQRSAKCVRSATGEVYVGQTATCFGSVSYGATGPGATTGSAVQRREVPHGLGRIVFKDGNEYSGEWRYGLKHGVGEFLFPDGEFYAGTYHKNSMSGYGLYIYTTGDIYEVAN
jgi:hypothetical protein